MFLRQPLPAKGSYTENIPLLFFFIQKEKAFLFFPFFSDHDIKFRNSPSGSFYDLIHLIVKDPAGLIFSVFFRLADCQAVLFKCHITVFCLHDPPADFYGLTKKQDYRKRQCSTQICKIPASFLVYEKVCADSLCHTAYCCHNKILFFKVHQMIYIIFCRL